MPDFWWYYTLFRTIWSQARCPAVSRNIIWYDLLRALFWGTKSWSPQSYNLSEGAYRYECSCNHWPWSWSHLRLTNKVFRCDYPLILIPIDRGINALHLPRNIGKTNYPASSGLCGILVHWSITSMHQRKDVSDTFHGYTFVQVNYGKSLWFPT